MTLHETAHSIHLLSHGIINGEKMTLTQLETYIRNLLVRTTPKLKDRIVIEVVLPDGKWLCEVIRYNNKRDGFNYEVPDTREQEARIWAKLLA